MNHSDSERVESVLQQCGFSPCENSEPDLYVVNTCSVRQRSEDKAYGFIVQQKRDFPNALVAVTGCMVRQTGDKSNSSDGLLKYDPIDMVFRIEDTARLPKLLESHFRDYDFSDFIEGFGAGSLENYFAINPRVQNRAQVYVPIMQGCDKFCTYCIVPYTRGRELSRPMADILKECETHVEHGAKEITLLGQNVNSYTDGGGSGKPKCFAELLRKIDTLHNKGLSRLRFTSAHPQDFTDDVIEALAEMKTSCPYVHLPVQHGSDRVLRAMNRNYTVAKYEDIIARIRKRIPSVTIATDIIVGFPGETEKDFQELCDFARRMKFDFSYTAIFSPRKNTPASRMEKEFIPDEEKRRRFHAFDEIIKHTSWENRERAVGQTLQVLVEKCEPRPDKLYQNSGRSREFFEVYFPAGRNLYGKEVEVEVVSRDGYVLYGEMKNYEGRITNEEK
ncbi:tRNA (N6-isopentenyl adenosine(37)-C2)-methylthiotransferase MiaB [Candidatus Gracilibacteria bacterium]|nr:tRNA (N6-isopentenyl adenosine(37)-C2)-methylthiotransferase MiaB [Candidatus Gracilibacteria bacterium]